MKNNETENDDGTNSETGTEFGCFHMNVMSKLPLPLRGIDRIQSVKPEELLARQVLAPLT